MSDSYSVCFYCADQNPPRDRSRGITAYTYGLLSHLRQATSVQLTAVVSKSSFAIPNGIERIMLPFRTDRLPGRLVGDHFHPVIVPGDIAQIWHYPKGFLPAGPQADARRVGTIADVILQFDADHHRESRPQLAFNYWLWLLRHSVRTLHLILTVSEFSKRAILEFCDRHRVSCPPIVVTYEGVEVSTPLENRRHPKENYVVHLASRQPSKATTWLLEQWSSLTKSRKDLPELQLVGNLDARGTAIFSKMANVSLVPPLPRLQLETLIAKARALLLPSEIEGFGIPAIEGYLLGTPVVYAKETAVEEILGSDAPGGFYRQHDSFEGALRETLNLDPAAVEKKAVTFRHRYSWNECLRRTLEAYRVVFSR